MDKKQEVSTTTLCCCFFYLRLTARLFPGVFLPVYRVCCLHHAALLHEGSHHRQRHHLLVTHRHAQRLSGRQSHRIGTASLAGEREDRGLFQSSGPALM